MFKLPDLPYAAGALAPVLSDTQLGIHHDKHHAKYVDTLNTMLSQSGDSPASLEELVKSAAAGSNRKLFNNAAQTWNHGFFWECMTPQAGQPTGELADAIEQSFGGLEQLRTRFVDEGVNHFASGWAWIVLKDGALAVTSTHDAATPIAEGGAPVLVCDVWEHAYYVDYKQDRKGFLEQWFDKVVNWDFVGQQYGAAKSGGQGYRYPAPA